MDSVQAKQPVFSQSDRLTTFPWPAECAVIAFFVYLALLGFLREIAPLHRVWLVSLPLLIWAGLRAESRNSRPWTRVLRQWISILMILVAYWSVECFATPDKAHHLQNLWIQWDRTLLDHFGLRAAIESGGAVLPFLLESAYLLLYAIPPVAMILLYIYGAPAARRRFLLTLLTGTFTVYGMLPLIAISSPRHVFPKQDEPGIVTAPRRINTWLLDHMDISTSVFPSGHVAVAFSTAFGLFAAIRHRRGIWAGAFAAATLVFIATIYGRYHFAVDGLASIAITAATSRLSETWSSLYES